MKIYIGYKYRFVDDKEALKHELNALSNVFESLGHTVFILGRDIQNWSKHTSSRISTLKDIIKNIGKHDIFFIYINSSARTNGIPVEYILAKLYGLKTVMARNNNVRPYFLERIIKDKFTFDSIEELQQKAKQFLG